MLQIVLDPRMVSNHSNITMMMIFCGIEIKLRKQASSFSDYSGSMDDSHLKDYKEKLTRFTSKSVDHFDPPLTAPSTDCVDSFTDQQQHGGNHDTHTTSLKLACQVSSAE